MKKTICLYFQVHQPFRLRRYRFFDIGTSEYYYDDYANETVMRKIAARCYLPANQLMLDLIEKHGDRFKIAFSISGVALDQFELYAPEVLEGFKKLAATGNVEFLAETHSHSLVSLAGEEEFKAQVTRHSERIESLFGQKPKVFRNTELIYSDEIGAVIGKLGFEGMLSEGARHILGWKSPNYLYHNSLFPDLKLLLRSSSLSDDLAFRFSRRSWDQWPLTAEKYVKWLKKGDHREEIINLFVEYETFGDHHAADSGIFEFFRALPGEILKSKNFMFSTPSDIISDFRPVASIHVPYPASWADEEKDLSAWLGNNMQNEAFKKLYALGELVGRTSDVRILTDWHYLQVSDHFYYMSTKVFTEHDVHKHYNPYESPYDAFINYMNVLSDFTRRIKKLVGTEESRVMKLERALKEKDEMIADMQRRINRMQEAVPLVTGPVGVGEEEAAQLPAKVSRATGTAVSQTASSMGVSKDKPGSVKKGSGGRAQSSSGTGKQETALKKDKQGKVPVDGSLKNSGATDGSA
jgi:alpha-amylase